MSFIQMSVPVVFWGRAPPSHHITCVCPSEEKRGVATGSLSGQICLWDIYRDRETEQVKLRPRCLLFGAPSPVKSLCFVRTFSGDRDRIASLSEKGTVSVWDGKDGACLKYISVPGKHYGIKALSRPKYSETQLVLFGQYSSIFILDAQSLDTICTLRSGCRPNWNLDISFLLNPDRKDNLLSLTVEGVAKMWVLPTRNEMKELGEIMEEKVTNLALQHPLSMSSCTHSTHNSTLIVCKEMWQLYNTTNGHVKLLLIRACEESVVSWATGDFIDYQTILTWSKGNGKGYVYRLSARCVPGLNESDESLDDSSTAGCSLIYSLAPPLSTSPSSHIAPVTNLSHYWCFQGDENGRLFLWNMHKLRHEHPMSHSHSPIPPVTSASVGDSWTPPAQPCGLTDMLHPHTPHSSSPTITCALYLSSFGRLVCGQNDGSIAVLSGTQAATVLLLQPRKFSRGWPQHCILRGHRNKVNHLLYPYSSSPAYNSHYLLSGGADFTVKLWDLFHGVLIHTFAVHGGGVKDIVTCPPDINPRLQTCVCSIGEDYSVAILSTSERKCLLMAACHSSPVRNVAWKLEEDFLLVSCYNGKLYVWQIETGSLDRCVGGETANIVLSNAQNTMKTTTTPIATPLQVVSLQAGASDNLIQVLLFDPQSLITRLDKMDHMTPKQEQQPKKQADAFRVWLSAKKHFGTGAQGGGISGPGRRMSTPPVPIELPAAHGSTRETERVREKLGQVVAAQNKQEKIQEEAPGTTVNIVRLLLSCLHAWSLDDQLDQSCEEILGLVRPSRPVSFGLLSKGQCMSLVLPGWGLKGRARLNTQASHEPPRGTTPIEAHLETHPNNRRSHSRSPAPLAPPTSEDHTPQTSTAPQTMSLSKSFSFDQKYHLRWQLSRSLTTQHLLTMVSVTNTLMNHSLGAHALATSSGMRKHRSSESEDSDWSDSEESQTLRDNQIRAVWSQVAALHCVMLPERMEGSFRAPHLPVLAARFLDPCPAIREASQALLQAELRRIGPEGRKKLVMEWSGRLQSHPIHKGRRVSVIDEGESSMGETGNPIPTQQQQTTALIILGMVGAEFHDGGRPKRRSGDTNKTGRKGHVTEIEVMDPAVARLTAKTLQAVLLEKPSSRSPLHSNLRCSAAELLGRGFHLWEKYVDIPQVVMGLLDLVIQDTDNRHGNTSVTHRHSRLFAAEVAHKALNLMILLRPVTMVTTLAKEVAMYLASQHITNIPHSSLQPLQVGVTPPPSTAGILSQATTLLPAAKPEILNMMKTVIEKSSQQISLQLLEVVDVVLFCLDQDQIKKKNLFDLFPVLSKMPNISYSLKARRLAVGARSGQVGIYDLKQGRTQMLVAHSHAVTVLLFSDDGRMLATYAYGDSTLTVWQLAHSLFGGTAQPKQINSWPAISSSSPSAYSSFIRLEWAGSRSIILHMPGGVECKYSL